MAFQSVLGSGKTKKATELSIGESFVGYVKGFVDNNNLGVTNMIMQTEDGESVTFFPAGNVKYAISDGKIKAGYLTRITRLEDKMIKGKRSSQFSVEQDFNSVLDEGATLEDFGINKESVAASVAIGVENAGKRGNLKERAAKLAGSVK